jgi:hypothetical protein
MEKVVIVEKTTVTFETIELEGFRPPEQWRKVRFRGRRLRDDAAGNEVYITDRGTIVALWADGEQITTYDSFRQFKSAMSGWHELLASVAGELGEEYFEEIA